MLYISVPVAIIYVIISAGFFWFGRDIIQLTVRKLKRYIAVCFRNVSSKINISSDNPVMKILQAVKLFFSRCIYKIKPYYSRCIHKIKASREKMQMLDHEIRAQFDELDMITTSAIAIMLSDAKRKSESPYIDGLKVPDIRKVLLSFCKDTYPATDMEQLRELFSAKYYKRKIRRYLGRVTVFVKRGISDSLPRKGAFRKARVARKRFLNKICETINTFESVKFIAGLSGNEEVSDSKRNYKLDHLSENYRDALIYLVDLLLTCTCISKMLLVERVVKRLDGSCEFVKIITNMAREIDDHNLIISKSRPVYKQYYEEELGYINGDDLLYGMAITVMVNRIRKTDDKAPEILHIYNRADEALLFEADMLKWLDELAVTGDTVDIGALILRKITQSIKGDFELLTKVLQELIDWEDFYYRRVSYHVKERDKERYLLGDFEKEKAEISRYS